MKNDSRFPRDTLSALYSQYNVERVDDYDFKGLFKSYSDWLSKIDENRSLIDTFVIHSGKAEISVIPINTTSQYVLVWDEAYWDFYDKFLHSFNSLWCIYCNNSLNEDLKNILYMNVKGFFTNSIIEYLTQRFHTYSDFRALLKTYRVDSQLARILISDTFINQSDNLLWVGKEFLLMHELEHILFNFSPEVFAHDSQCFDEAIDYYHDNFLPLIDESIIPGGSARLKPYVEQLQKDKNSNNYNELFNDYHGFFEIMDHHHENIRDTFTPFTPMSQTYLFSVKLLKMFDSCKNFMTRVIENALSTKYYPKEKRIERVNKVSSNCQSMILCRDYLAGELLFTGLYLCAKEFPGFNEQAFSEQHNTKDFTSPYSNYLEPIVKDLTSHIANRIIQFL